MSATATATTTTTDDIKNTSSNDFFDKLAACLPPAMADMTASEKSFENNNEQVANNKSTTEPESLNNVLEQFKNFHETLITEKFDGFKTQKSELELLKEKIMKLEERNNELEKKLNTNTNSKENSLNDSFSLAANSIETATAKSTDVVETQQVKEPQQQPIIFNNIQQQQQPKQYILPQTPSIQQNSSLKNIPNINQGGFIITSNGSIAYVPPGSQSFTSSTPKTAAGAAAGASSSFTACSSTSAGPSNYDLNSFSLESTTKTEQQVDKNNINLDISSFLSKNIFNVNTPQKQTAAVASSPVTSPKKIEIKPKPVETAATAFILSASGQLLPINQPTASTSSTTTPFILPKPAATTATPTPIAPKQPKQKTVKPKLAKKPIQAKPEPVKIEIAPQPAPQIEPTSSQSSLTAKHRAIRPKPSSNCQLTTPKVAIAPKPIAPVLSIQQPLLVLPNTLTSPNKQQNYGIIKINTVSPAKTDPNSTKSNVNSTIMLEANDILSKAASMIFSPSEFALNNLSPNTNNASSNLTTTTSPSTNTIIFPSNSTNQNNATDSASVTTNSATTPVAPPAGKIAIQRNNSQQSILPKKLPISRTLVPKATSQDNLTQPKQNKIAIKKNPTSTSLKKSTTTTITTAKDETSTKKSKASSNNNNNNNNKTEKSSTMDIEKALDSMITTAESLTSETTQTKQQQEQFDMQIQLQLQSILNGTAPAQKGGSPLLSPPKQKAEPAAVGGGVIESMPSLDDFFGFEAIDSKPAAPKPVTPKGKNSKLKPKPAKQQQEVTSPLKTTSPKSKNVQIRPKPGNSKSSKSAKHSKLELGDFDKVLEQVESIASLTQSNDNNNNNNSVSERTATPPPAPPTTNKSNNEFLFDLLSIENSSPSAGESSAQQPAANINGSITNEQPKKKANLLKKIEKSSSVLSTPPSIQTTKPSKKPLKPKSTTTPIKINNNNNNTNNPSLSLDDPDFFSFLKDPVTIDELKRTPLKAENNNSEQTLAKKRGRPPKPLKQTDKNDEHVVDSDLDGAKKQCHSDDNNNKCILNTAVQNTFHDLINSNFTADSKPRDKSTDSAHNTSTNNKENATVETAASTETTDMNNFVYDIAMAENTQQIDEPQQADVTLASLMCPIRNRKRTRKPDPLEGKKSTTTTATKAVVSEERAELKIEEEPVGNEPCEDGKRRKKSVEFDVPIEFETNEQNDEGENEKQAEESICSLIQTNEKRKRGRPAKATQPTAAAAIESEVKAPNYKKISNPCGTTSLLALNTPPTNIEYAGLTRFEIPFETEEETNQTKSNSSDESDKKEVNLEVTDKQAVESEPISLESIQKSIMDFAESAPTTECAEKESKPTESSETKPLTDQEGEKSQRHMSHYDLENDPIINKDLQQLHNNTPVPVAAAVDNSHLKQQQTTTTLTNHFIGNIASHSSLVTPPSTVCSVPSSVSSTTSNNGQFGSSSAQNNLSINPSSTSSTSSTQMISPVSNDCIRNPPNNDHHFTASNQGSYYQQQQQQMQHNYYHNNNQFNQTYPAKQQQQQQPKPTSPAKYSNNYPTTTTTTASTDTLNTSHNNLDTSNHNHNQSPHNNNLYRSNSSTNLQPQQPPICKTPQQQQQQHQLNTSQSPQHRHSMSLCSTPTPTPTPTTPTNNYNASISPSAAAATTTTTTTTTSTKAPIKIAPPALPNMYQPHQAHMYQHQNPFVPPSFPLLPSYSDYNTTQYNSQQQQQTQNQQYQQYQHHQQPPIQQQQQHQQHQQASNSYLPTPTQNHSQNYYQQQQQQSVQAPNRSNSYLPNLYPQVDQPNSEPPKKTKQEKKTTSKTKAKSSKNSASLQPPPQQQQQQQQTQNYPSHHQQHQPNYDKLMSATALHAAANWYDFTSQVSKGTSSEAAAIASLSTFFQKQADNNGQSTSQWPSNQSANPIQNQQQPTNQYNAQFQQSSLNSLFAPSSHKQATKPEPAPTRHQTPQAPTYQNQSHYQQPVPQYQKQTMIPRSGSSSNLTESAYRQQQQQNNHGNHEPQNNSYYQTHHHHQQIPHHHPPVHHQNNQATGNTNGPQFPSYQNQFTAQNAAAMRHPTSSHLAAPNPALAFPHHQAVAMNNLLANQFSNVPQFNWHPKI